MSIDTTPLTWGEVSIIASVMTVVCGGIAAYIMRQIGNLGKALDGQKVAFSEHRLEMARTYATIATVTEVERRLTDTVSQMISQISTEMGHMTDTIRQLFGELLHQRRSE